MRLIRKISRILLLSGCVGIYGYSAIDISNEKVFSVSVDLSNPEKIVWPFEISIVGDMGEKGLRIGPKMGAGWRGKVGGEATYRFYAPEDGKYHIWAYCLWFDKCTNAVYAKIDTLDKAIIGNDPIFQKWHWVRGFSVDLSKGPHALKLSNHSDHIAVQKLLFVNSGIAVPDDCELVFSDVFYDGFDGCHIGNFTSWQQVSGEWSVKKPAEQECYIETALFGESNDLSLITYEGSNWANYSFSVAVKSLPCDDSRAMTGICFGVKDPQQYYQLKWRETTSEGVAFIELSEKRDQEAKVIIASEVRMQTNEWNLFEVHLKDKLIEVNIEDEQVIQAPIDREIIGGIGLLLQDNSKAYFDDIHIKTTYDSTSQ